MGRYHARDLLRVPSLLSLARLPLAVAFPFAVDRPTLAFAILLAAGTSDVADGWYARRYHQVTATGSVLNPVSDKLFVLTVAITLMVTGQLSTFAVVLLSVREIGELPLVLWLAFSRAARRARAEAPRANVPGKLATGLQFAAVSLALFRAPLVRELTWATAVVGLVAAIAYTARELRLDRATRTAADASDASGASDAKSD